MIGQSAARVEVEQDQGHASPTEERDLAMMLLGVAGLAAQLLRFVVEVERVLAASATSGWPWSHSPGETLSPVAGGVKLGLRAMPTGKHVAGWQEFVGS